MLLVFVLRKGRSLRSAGDYKKEELAFWTVGKARSNTELVEKRSYIEMEDRKVE